MKELGVLLSSLIKTVGTSTKISKTERKLNREKWIEEKRKKDKAPKEKKEKDKDEGEWSY